MERASAGECSPESQRRASGVLNVFVPGGFEALVPWLVAWAADHAGTASSC